MMSTTTRRGWCTSVLFGEECSSGNTTNTASTFSFANAPASNVRYPVTAVCVYLCVVFGLQRVMRGRRAMKLKAAAFVHNVFLCALSLAMAIGTLYEVIRIMRTTGGLMGVICDDTSRLGMGGNLGKWMYIFYLSKFYELFDTLLMVLKKRPLNFLHVYHHSIVLPLFYVYMRTDMVLQWILVVANSLVHVAMYYYYANATIGRKIWWKKYITQAQIVQFIIDLTATWPYPFFYFSKGGCSGNLRGWLFGQAVGASFFKLFSDFYAKAYAKAKAQRLERGRVGATTTSNTSTTETPGSSSKENKDEIEKDEVKEAKEENAKKLYYSSNDPRY